MNKQIKPRTIIIAAVILLIVIMLLPLPLPYHLMVQGKIVPGKVWLLHQQTDGSLLVTLRDHLHNLVSGYTAYQVERGDVLSFQLKSDLRSDGSIAAGDTIGFIHSNVISQEMALLKGSLEVAQSMLQVNQTGEKESLIDAARSQLSLSREQADLQKKILERQKELYDSSLVSKEIYEITLGTSRIYDLQAAAAEAQLKALQTGAKPEQVHLSQAEINSLKGEIKVLEQRLQQFVLIAPINGQIFTPFSAETLMFVADTSRVVYIPVNILDGPEVEVNQKVQVRMEAGSEITEGKIYKVDNMVQRLVNKQVFFAICILDSNKKLLPVNQIVSCRIQGRSKTPLDYLGKLTQSIFN
jgi:hypothetical protein